MRASKERLKSEEKFSESPGFRILEAVLGEGEISSGKSCDK